MKTILADLNNVIEEFEAEGLTAEASVLHNVFLRVAQRMHEDPMSVSEEPFSDLKGDDGSMMNEMPSGGDDVSLGGDYKPSPNTGAADGSDAFGPSYGDDYAGDIHQDMGLGNVMPDEEEEDPMAGAPDPLYAQDPAQRDQQMSSKWFDNLASKMSNPGGHSGPQMMPPSAMQDSKIKPFRAEDEDSYGDLLG